MEPINLMVIHVNIHSIIPLFVLEVQTKYNLLSSNDPLSSNEFIIQFKGELPLKGSYQSLRESYQQPLSF